MGARKVYKNTTVRAGRKKAISRKNTIVYRPTEANTQKTTPENEKNTVREDAPRMMIQVGGAGYGPGGDRRRECVLRYRLSPNWIADWVVRFVRFVADCTDKTEDRFVDAKPLSSGRQFTRRAAAPRKQGMVTSALCVAEVSVCQVLSTSFLIGSARDSFRW